MEEIFCPSYYFINKQNLRSFSNLKCFSLLKRSDNSFVQMMPDKDSVIPEKMLSIMKEIKGNLLYYSKDDFHLFFAVKDYKARLLPVDKEFILQSCSKALLKIIPKYFYGSNHNTKLFYDLVKTSVYSSYKQFFKLHKYLCKWDCNVEPWNFDGAQSILACAIKWMLQYVLAPIIALNFHVTTCKLDQDEYKLLFFWKSVWHSYYDRVIYKMNKLGVLKKFNEKSYRISKSSRHDLKQLPKLSIVLKKNDDYRPIVKYRNDPKNMNEKKKVKNRLNFLKSISEKPYRNIQSCYNNIFNQWHASGRPKLYFIKTDLSNAFGSVNTALLIQILHEKYTKFMNTETDSYIKSKSRDIFQSLITELQKPFLIRSGSTVYEWKKGLVQGYKYSPALSEIYYEYLDLKYFANLKVKNIHFLTRVVDDYLLITDSLETAHMFLKSMSNYSNINHTKTEVNFPHPTIKFNKDITFLGYVYNTQTLQVSKSNNVISGPMFYKIAFSQAINNFDQFLDNRIGQSGIKINKHIFNFHYNTEDIVWRQIFHTYCLSANKFCTILAVLLKCEDMSSYLVLYKKRVVEKLTNTIINTLCSNKPVDYVFRYCVNHFRYLAWLSLLYCSKDTPQCSVLVPKIIDEVAKCNCLFGKWREHFCSTTKGDKNMAVREICKRSDLKEIFKDFKCLPDVVCCYNHRRRE